MPEYKAFIFGAGASVSEGGLLTSDLLFRSLKNPRVNRWFVSVVRRFLKDLFGVVSVDAVKSKEQLPSFEELLTIVDVAILKREEFSGYWNRKSLLELHEALVYCIAAILRISIEGKTDDSLIKHHRRFVDTIFDINTNNTANENSFISLNYDILLDSALLSLRPEWDVDYGIKFRNFANPRQNLGIKLLKLHGSLNWKFCPVCNSMELNLEGKIADKIITERIRCSKDKAVQRPVIIPPTWLKVYDNAYLVKIWSEAEHVLRRSSKVFFIGCSLPESDFHIRYLLKKSLYRFRKKPPEIIIITRPKNKENSCLHRRYQRFFGSVRLEPIGFEAFADDPSKYL